jgi:glycosyltransferase involved in cell wall biosynthesis
MRQTQQNRIVWLIDSLGLGGAERLLVNYLPYFNTARFQSRVCALQVKNGNPIAADIRRLGVPVDFVPLRHLRDPLGLPRLVRYLRRHGPGLLHTQLEFADTLGSVAAKILHLPSVTTLHTLNTPDQGTRRYWRHQLQWWSLRHFCDRVVAVSEGARQHHIRLGKLAPEKVVTLYNGIDLSGFSLNGQFDRRASRQALGIPPDAPLLITVAVLRPPKGIQYLIEALPTILQAVPEARYLVVGDGQHKNSLKVLAQTYGVAERVIFTGARSDIPALLALSDLFVLPTLTEALPTVLAEAMAAQKPIVASNVGGVPEMIEHGRNGLLVPPADPASLAAACLQLLQDQAHAQAMACAGREIVEQRFNIHKQVAHLGDLYQELLAKGRE